MLYIFGLKCNLHVLNVLNVPYELSRIHSYVVCRIMSIKLNSDWTFNFWYGGITKLKPRLVRIEYSSTFKPIWFSSCNHSYTPSCDTT